MTKREQLLVKVIHLKGSYYQFGLDQSKEATTMLFKEKIDILQQITNHSNGRKAKELLQHLSPNLLQELDGLSKGLNMSLDETIRLFSGYDIEYPEMGCTTLVHDGNYIRNYDFSHTFYDARMVFTYPQNGYSSVGFSHTLIGRLDGMNEKGLVVGLHFVNNQYKQEGFLATTIVRILLEECASTEEAVELIKAIPHGYCYNYSITDRAGKTVKIEATPQQQLETTSNPLVCTNHFEQKNLEKQNQKDISRSVNRKNYLEQLLRKKLTALSAYYHFNKEGSPLFFTNYKEYFGTLHTVVYVPTNLSLLIGVGGNCEPVKISLRDTIKGETVPPTELKGSIKV
mgnify:CR=1 FL=1